MADVRTITLRRADVCAGCGAALQAGTTASWDAHSRTVICLTCTDRHTSSTSGVAGASARAKGERDAAREVERRRDLKARRPVVGRIKLAMEGQPRAGTSYLRGAVGEEKLGARLDEMAGEGVFVLHDRRRPGTAANIDHLVVASCGVWVIDAKRYVGLVTKVDRGGWFKQDVRLVIGGQDRSSLVAEVHKQVADVVRALARVGHAVPVHGSLYFVDAEFRLLARPFEIDGILITWAKALRERIRTPGPLTEGQCSEIHDLLRRSLPPAS